MKYIKIYNEKIPSEVLITHKNLITEQFETHHYCFKASKAQCYLTCYKLDGKKVELMYFMAFVLSNKHVILPLKNFLKLKAFM